MRVAIDFDGVIFNKTTSRIIDGCVKKIRDLHDDHEITIFTNRPDYDYSTVKQILDSNFIPFDRLICGKPSYDLFIDDRAAKFIGWEHEYTI